MKRGFSIVTMLLFVIGFATACTDAFDVSVNDMAAFEQPANDVDFTVVAILGDNVKVDFVNEFDTVQYDDGGGVMPRCLYCEVQTIVEVHNKSPDTWGVDLLKRKRINYKSDNLKHEQATLVVLKYPHVRSGNV